MHAVSVVILLFASIRNGCGLLEEKSLLGGAFRVCRRSDPRLEQCVVDSLNGARAKLSAGIPDLNIPPLNPLRGEKLIFKEGEEDFHFQVEFTNWSWDGLADFVATKAKIDLEQPYIELEMTNKALNLAGNYKFGGSFLTLRIRGEGEFEILWGANVTHRISFQEETRNGEKYWKASDYKWSMKIFSFHCNFRNLFGGNKRLGLYANQFLNRNWKPAHAVYGHVVHTGFVKPIKGFILDKFFERVPVSQLFAP